MYKIEMDRWAPVYVEDELESTNSALKTMSAESGTVLLARRQSGGRGRRGRSFDSPQGGLYFSYLLRPDCPVQECAGLSALAALAVQDALEKFAGIKAGLKWPNDLMLNGKKLCGILTELSVNKQGRPEAIIGVGLNLNTPADSFPVQIKDIACSVYSETGRLSDADEALRCIITELDSALAKWADDKNFFMQRYRQHNLCMGREVLVITGQEKKPARVLDINNDLSLQVMYENGQQEALYSGDISIRM